MKTCELLASLLFLFGGCASSDAPLTTFDASRLHVWSFANSHDHSLEVQLSRAGNPLSLVTDQADACVRIRDTTRMTVNGAEGSLIDPGGFGTSIEGDNQSVTGCLDPQLLISESDSPPALAIVLDDASGQLELDLAKDAGGQYQVMRCTAVECSISQ